MGKKPDDDLAGHGKGKETSAQAEPPKAAEARGGE